MKSRTRFWKIATIVWIAVIFSFSLRTGEESGGMSLAVLTYILDTFLPKLADKVDFETLHLLLRKVAHFSEYFILGVLSYCTMQGTQRKRKTTSAIIFCVGIGVIDEALQLFVSGRVGSFWDVLIDSAGATVAIGILCCIKKIRKRKKKSW